jgi:ketosteroid isomerase-like protein
MMKRIFLNVTLAAIVAIGPSAPSMADEISAASKAVWQRHLQSAAAGDIDAVMADFAEDSVIMTTEGIIEGKPAIQKFFKAFLAGATPEAKDTVVVNAEVVHGKVVLFNFTVGVANQTYHDTAVIEGDKIMVLTTVGYPAE